MYISLIQNIKLRAIGWMVLNCFMAASVLGIVKYFTPHINISILITSYHLVATIFVAIIIIYFGYSIKTKILYLHFLRSLLGVIAYFLYFNALSMTSIANVVALGYTDSILTCIFSYLFLKDHLSRTHIINLILSFVGAMIIIKPNMHILNLGALLACISAVLWALSNVIIKIIGKEDEAYVQLFYSNFFTFCLAGIVVIYQGSIWDIGAQNIHYNWIILLAIMASIQSFALFKSLSLGKVGVVMPFFIVTVVFVHIYGYVFFGEIQDAREIIGTILVISVGFLQIFRVKS